MELQFAALFLTRSEGYRIPRWKRDVLLHICDNIHGNALGTLHWSLRVLKHKQLHLAAIWHKLWCMILTIYDKDKYIWPFFSFMDKQRSSTTFYLQTCSPKENKRRLVIVWQALSATENTRFISKMISRVDNTAMEKEGVSPKPSRSTSNNPQRSDTQNLNIR